jgi:RimJ/RimL family protein N-acetyltransferase
MTNNGTVTLETGRLILRPLAESDFDAVHAYMTDEQVKKFMYYEPNTPEVTRKLIADSITDEHIFEFGITGKISKILIGNIGLYIGGKEADGYDEAEIGWLVNRENQGRGFATEAAKAVVEFAFERLELRRIIAHCDSENAASWHVMENLGMRREAHYRKSRKSNRILGHSWRDAFGYAILRDEYCYCSNPASFLPILEPDCDYWLPHVASSTLREPKSPSEPNLNKTDAAFEQF